MSLTQRDGLLQACCGTIPYSFFLCVCFAASLLYDSCRDYIGKKHEETYYMIAL